MKIRFNNAILTVAAIAMAALSALPASGEAPTGYYSSIYGKSGRELKNSVYSLIRPHNVLTYGSLWYHFPYTDCRLDNPSVVWDMYSAKTYYFRSGGSSVSGMNKEHSVPKSWWGGYEIDAYTDLNHLYPSDATANTAKLNYPLGEVSKIDFNNGVTKTGSPVTGQGGGSAVVFEPADEYKGDFARTYFYMATCYSTPATKVGNEPDLTWKYTYMMNNSDWLTLQKWAIDMMLRWAREDPVSDKEIARNDAVYKIQNNRNPFIDHPDLIEYIWGEKAGQPYNPDDIDPDDPDPSTRLVNPTQDLTIEFGEVGLGKMLQTTVYVKGKHLTGNLSVTVYRDDAAMFKTSVAEVPRMTAMTDQGYPLVITYTPTTVGEHTCRLIISDGGLTGSYGAQLKAACRPKPTLTAPVALPAQNVTSTGYTAMWQAASEEVDFYIITRTVYGADNTVVERQEFTTEDIGYYFDDLQPGQRHTYHVQSSRLGYTSEPSNEIELSTSGIDDIGATMPAAFLAMDGAVRVKCGDALRGVDIYNINGQHVRHLEAVYNDDIIALPRGIYILTTAGYRPAKLVIK